MKNKNYWICKDSQGLYLYIGDTEPTLEGDSFVPNEDGNWVSDEVLDNLGILYPKDLSMGTCKQMKIRIKSKW